MSEHSHVMLGQHSLPVYEQAPMRIIRRIGKLGDAFTSAVVADGDFDPKSFFSGLGDRVYYLFVTFIPNLPERMPEWEFWGYDSRDAYDSDSFDDDKDGANAATFTQWLDAFDVIVEVNGGKRFLALLGQVLDWDMIKAELSLGLSEWRERIGSPSLPGPNGTSGPTSSGPTNPITAELDTAPESESNSATPTSSGSRQPVSA